MARSLAALPLNTSQHCRGAAGFPTGAARRGSIVLRAVLCRVRRPTVHPKGNLNMVGSSRDGVGTPPTGPNLLRRPEVTDSVCQGLRPSRVTLLQSKPRDPLRRRSSRSSTNPIRNSLSTRRQRPDTRRRHRRPMSVPGPHPPSGMGSGYGGSWEGVRTQYPGSRPWGGPTRRNPTELYSR